MFWQKAFVLLKVLCSCSTFASSANIHNLRHRTLKMWKPNQLALLHVFCSGYSQSCCDKFNFRNISISPAILSCLLGLVLLGPPPTTFPAPIICVRHEQSTEHGLLCFIKWDKWEIAFFASRQGQHSTGTAFPLLVLSMHFLACIWLLLSKM